MGEPNPKIVNYINKAQKEILTPTLTILDKEIVLIFSTKINPNQEEVDPSSFQGLMGVKTSVKSNFKIKMENFILV